jgi:hypothetical protein
MDFENFVVTPAVMLLLIFGIVEFIKTFGVQGSALRLASLSVGILIAVVFKLRDVFPHAVTYIDIGFFGVAAGLAASGIYDYLKKLQGRA